MADKVTGKSRGFGFVYFADEKGLRSAIDGQHGTEWEGRRISVTRAIPQNETAPGTPASVLTGGRDGRPGRCALPLRIRSWIHRLSSLYLFPAHVM